ncbi:MAG: hypothetical protein ACRD2A_15780, partial [Vicinamibacterales bacterium]
LLPNGGGYPVSFYTRNSRSPLGATDNYYSFASDYGDVTAYWQGIDLQINARLGSNLTVQGGFGTGQGVQDYCPVMEKLPETHVTPLSVLVNEQVKACAVNEPWLTSLRGLVAYTIPRIDVLVSSSFRSAPGVQPSTVNTFVATNGRPLMANYNVTNAILQQSNLGRPLAGLAFQTVSLVLPGELYGDRINSLDLRVGKIVRFGRYRANVGFDFYNLFNINTGTAFNQVYDVNSNGATWFRPTSVVNARFARFNMTIDF